MESFCKRATVVRRKPTKIWFVIFSFIHSLFFIVTIATANQEQLSWDNKIQYYSSHNFLPQLLDTVTELVVAISNGSESTHRLSELVNHFKTVTSYSNDLIRDQLTRLTLNCILII